MDGLSELGAMVSRLRTEAGLSGAELARRAGVPQPSVSQLEAGRRLADDTVSDRLVSALSLDAATAGRVRAPARGAYAVPYGRRVSAGALYTTPTRRSARSTTPADGCATPRPASSTGPAQTATWPALTTSPTSGDSPARTAMA
jgi:transcriptional regulator with XRE-family HTH domain